MGAIDRRYERGIERKLAARKQKGVLPPAWHAASRASASGVLDDRRAAIPPLGLREYWYPAVPAGRVGRKPLYWAMLGDDLVFFRDKGGNVVALSDVCPHRGASLSEGDCFYRGTVTCPYHGATFDGRGECLAFLTEGPDSTMPGKLRVRPYPTRTVRGWVFVWMGAGEPAPLAEDVPPEFFEPETEVLSTYTYWPANWMVAIENQADAHNCFFVHRNSLIELLHGGGGRPRTPIGPRSKLVNGRALVPLRLNKNYYADKNGGELPHQMFYAGVDGQWPLHRWRAIWGPLFQKYVLNQLHFDTPEEWSGGHHLPCLVRSRIGGRGMYTRYAVPVTPNLSRVIYFHSARPKNELHRFWERLCFHAFYNWMIHYNFSGQDNGATAPCRYWTEEYLSPTDSHLILLRKLVVEGSRDALRRQAEGTVAPMAAETSAEQFSYELQEAMGLTPEVKLHS
jgi:phenylpropionate dioxygenase-like ring-hydroxylating dioxygenase large terminal subunit